MKLERTSRRQFLYGPGGFALGIPFLPSLVPGRAWGAEPAPPRQRRFVAMTTNHGGVAPENMHPADSSLTDSTTLWGSHVARHGALRAQKTATHTSLSKVLTAKSSVLTDRLIARMNVLRGFDIPYYIGHHTGGHLGNFIRSDQGPQNLRAFPTIDQVMAWSPRFYPDLTGVRERSAVTGFNFHGISFGWSNPAAKSGTVQKVGVEINSGRLFDKLFGAGVPTPSPSVRPRIPIVDRIVANYRSLAQSNRRLSADDRRRLTDHIARLDELERKLGTGPTQTCTATPPKTSATIVDEEPGAAEAARRHQILNDVVAMALACGVTRIATIVVFYSFSDWSGSFHQDVAHQHTDPAKQKLMTDALQLTFEAAIADLASKLDAIEDAPGVSVLDNTLLQWTQESGWMTHEPQDMTIVTFGGAGGYFNTGLFVDYRNPSARMGGKQSLGLWHRQWLATALQSMGIPPSEFEYGGKTGYGDAYMGSVYQRAVHPEVIAQASDPIKVITKMA